MEKSNNSEPSSSNGANAYVGDSLCPGCNVTKNWEHRCHGDGCSCNEVTCMERQGRITHEELMKIVNKELYE